MSESRFGKIYKQGHSLVVAIPASLAKREHLSPGDSIVIGFAELRSDAPGGFFFFFKKVPANAVLAHESHAREKK